MAGTRPLRLVLVAGEASGDLLGADLARALKQQHDNVELAGITGPQMQAAGVAGWFDIEALSVMGLTEVLRHLPRLVQLRKNLRNRIVSWPADALITIDAPDFNLGLARQLHDQGLITIHYVSPSVWAWRAGRIPRIARSLDQLLTLFPFE
ncbi:MAG TPA: lipid-A-disaccharide synthase, partial [Wenzhouxiangella sp.]|nr:lipid-A-disaccharide synthase [Wenzhouxiangella sp.]